jgi:serine protease Do
MLSTIPVGKSSHMPINRPLFFAAANLSLLICMVLLTAGCAQNQSAAPLAPAALVAQAADAPGPDPYPAATPKRVVAVTSIISPAVVRIDVAQSIFRDGKESVQRGIGSGVIIDQDGRILTNYHVAGRAAEIYVTLSSEERLPAHLIGDDHWTDLAIVQMDMAEVQKRHISFQSATLGNSSTLVVGQDVMAFGTPYGLARTVTGGHVSATERTLYPSRLDIDGYETGDFANWIQMDAPINPGNSGGPLVDMNGLIVGINTRGGAQNLNFAVPIDIARQVIAWLEKTAVVKADGTVTTLGYVPRSELGMEFKPLQDLETFYHLEIDQGVLVDSVQHGSPAEAAGVRSQDILLAINGLPTNVRFPEELAPVRKRIGDLPIGSVVTLSIKRGSQLMQLQATTDALQGYFGEERAFSEWGLSVQQVTRPFANMNQLDAARGVWVTSISPELPADKANVQEGDVILSVGQAPIATLADFAQAYRDSIRRKDSAIPLQMEHDRTQRTVLLRIDNPDSLDGGSQDGN